jgi:hypothetical protein
MVERVIALGRQNGAVVEGVLDFALPSTSGLNALPYRRNG